MSVLNGKSHAHNMEYFKKTLINRNISYIQHILFFYKFTHNMQFNEYFNFSLDIICHELNIFIFSSTYHAMEWFLLFCYTD